MERFDVLIVGSGPAGIFAAREILREHPGAKVAILEKGHALEKRVCPSRMTGSPCRAERCPTCSLLAGWGGAGAFSDGKLTLSPEIGGNLGDYVGRDGVAGLLDQVDRVFLEFGAPATLWGTDEAALEALRLRAAVNGFTFVPSRIRHLGTDHCLTILGRFHGDLSGKCAIRFDACVESVVVEEGKVAGVRLAGGKTIRAPFVVVATGREGAPWFQREVVRLGLPVRQNPVDLGVRVEVPAEILAPVAEATYEPKLIHRTSTFDDAVRTFCVCPNGEVIREFNQGIHTVNGHSYAEPRGENSNFALLVSTTFTEPFDDPVAYGRSIAKLANLLSQGVLVQRLSDLRAGRRSTAARIREGRVAPTLADAVPGDLSFVLPYRILKDLLETLEALEGIVPGVWSGPTLLYGVEVKFYSLRLTLGSTLETGIANLFAVGDGAGVSRGLIQAAASGVVAAREIARRL
jgi:hypothetical protein